MHVTIAAALHHARQQLTNVSDTPQVDARRILASVLQKSPTWLLAHMDAELADEQHIQFETYVAEYATGRPLPYILGEWPFYNWTFRVTEDVLIPRPETEELVARAAEWLNAQCIDYPVIIDVGAGSGAIAISLALLFPKATVYALDISSAAVALTQQNAQRLKANNVQCLQSNLLAAVSDNVQADLVVANLPYIGTDIVKTLDVARWEPMLALDGGLDGLRAIRQLLIELPCVATTASGIFLEIGADQGGFFQSIRSKYASVSVYKDLSGRDRIVSLTLQESAICP